MAENPGRIAVFIDCGGAVGFRVGGEVYGTERQVGIIDLWSNPVLRSLIDLLIILDRSFTSIFEILLCQVVADLIKRWREGRSGEVVVWEIGVDDLVRFCNIPDNDDLRAMKEPLARLLGGIVFRGNINMILAATWRLLKADGFLG
jgi:hypothetical protein